ncbi:MAG: metallopeptidase family protein, partial [Desulfobacterota bacterium]|nr:metallopeptidase family protein [Thermodesulfobacteriota bacterium]
MKLTRQEFEEAVWTALERLPEGVRKKMENVDVVIEDQADPELLSEMGLDSPDDLLGLYQGIPITQRGVAYGNVLPDK